jgi:hypothetical protein
MTSHRPLTRSGLINRPGNSLSQCLWALQMPYGFYETASSERTAIIPTVYVRRVNLKDTRSDAEIVAYWKWRLEEVVPPLLKSLAFAR